MHGVCLPPHALKQETSTMQRGHDLYHGRSCIFLHVQHACLALDNRWPRCSPLTRLHFHMQEVTPRIYHLFQQSPWWHRYASSPQQPQPYFTSLLYRKDVFKSSESFQLHPFTRSAMGKHLCCLSMCAGRASQKPTFSCTPPLGGVAT